MTLTASGAGPAGTSPPGRLPLAGVTVVELAGAGPVPFAATMLADLGARIIRIDRPGPPIAQYPRDPTLDVLGRGRESILLDLKGGGLEVALRLVDRADAFVEGLRPGTAERLGIGPDACLERNPRLVYGRVSGWGRTGPLAARPGHDINFIAVGGALRHIVGRDGAPAFPLSLVGDYGGGGMCLALGVSSALLAARGTGRGCIIDTSLLDAVAALMSPLWGIRADGEFDDQAPGSNVADGGAPFWNVYRCADGRFLAVGAIEDRFRTRLAGLLGTEAVLGQDRARWAEQRAQLDRLFATRTRAQWCALLEDEDVCVSPVLSLSESPQHRQFAARDWFADGTGVTQPRPAWTVDDAPLAPPPPAPPRGRDGLALLSELGYPAVAVDELIRSGAVGLVEK